MSLDREQKSRLLELLDDALAIAPEERAAWLANLPAADEALLPQLRTSLQVPEAVITGFLEFLPSLDSDTLPEEDGLDHGARVGPYRLLRRIGSGGMAQVWLAERADGAFQRELALKIPTQVRQRPDLAERFRRERDILAALEHPNIARLYDAGVADDGTPYVAIEYVKGKDVISWADERRLSLKSRLRLFLQVLDAVSYAHAKGVLHRDIKPSNILVNDEGQVRLLDFGVAKILRDTTGTMLTRHFGRMLTPVYASPEQMSGSEPGRESDIYSLGILLHELLCGSRPQLDTPSATKPPSTRVNPTAAAQRSASMIRLASALKGDLDAIVAKALDVDPVNRYLSAEALGDDIRRYLDGVAVLAHAGGWWYRTSKHLGRHPWFFAMAASVTLLASVAVLFQVMQGVPLRVDAVHERSALPTDAKSVAVLPFVDLNTAHDLAYLSDGLAAELISRLAQSRELRVTARTSSFSFRGSSEMIPAIAQKLGVAYVLEGSVKREGKQLRIQTELVRGNTGDLVWAKTFVRPTNDFVLIQDEIAGMVASALTASLGPNTAVPPSGNFEAYEAYLKAMEQIRLETAAGNRQAAKLLEKAVQIDPQYASAMCWRANVAKAQMEHGEIGDAAGSQLTMAWVQRALSVDPTFAPAYLAIGNLHLNHAEMGRARDAYRRALDLDPNQRSALANLAFASEFAFGDFEHTLALNREDAASDPRGVSLWRMLMWQTTIAGHYSEALDIAHRIEALAPQAALLHTLVSYVHLLAGRPQAALAELAKEPEAEMRDAVMPIVTWALGRHAESDASMIHLEKTQGASDAYSVADAHAYRGEKDLAIEWLRRSLQRREALLQYVRIDPFLASLHGDPRYRDILAAVQLDDASR